MSKEEGKDKMSPCKCCGALEISEVDNYEICSICGWEDDPVQSADPEREGGANLQSLKMAKQVWCRRVSAKN